MAGSPRHVRAQCSANRFEGSLIPPLSNLIQFPVLFLSRTIGNAVTKSTWANRRFNAPFDGTAFSFAPHLRSRPLPCCPTGATWIGCDSFISPSTRFYWGFIGRGGTTIGKLSLLTGLLARSIFDEYSCYSSFFSVFLFFCLLMYEVKSEIMQFLVIWFIISV